MRHLTVFHNYCVRTILGITRYEQWKQQLMSAMLLDRFRIESISRMIIKLGEMKKKRTAHGPRKCWRDLISNDLKLLGMDGCYELC